MSPVAEHEIIGETKVEVHPDLWEVFIGCSPVVPFNPLLVHAGNCNSRCFHPPAYVNSVLATKGPRTGDEISRAQGSPPYYRWFDSDAEPPVACLVGGLWQEEIHRGYYQYEGPHSSVSPSPKPIYGARLPRGIRTQSEAEFIREYNAVIGSPPQDIISYANLRIWDSPFKGYLRDRKKEVSQIYDDLFYTYPTTPAAFVRCCVPNCKTVISAEGVISSSNYICRYHPYTEQKAMAYQIAGTPPTKKQSKNDWKTEQEILEIEAVNNSWFPQNAGWAQGTEHLRHARAAGWTRDWQFKIVSRFLEIARGEQAGAESVCREDMTTIEESLPEHMYIMYRPQTFKIISPEVRAKMNEFIVDAMVSGKFGPYEEIMSAAIKVSGKDYVSGTIDVTKLLNKAGLEWAALTFRDEEVTKLAQEMNQKSNTLTQRKRRALVRARTIVQRDPEEDGAKILAKISRAQYDEINEEGGIFAIRWTGGKHVQIMPLACGYFHQRHDTEGEPDGWRDWMLTESKTEWKGLNVVDAVCEFSRRHSAYQIYLKNLRPGTRPVRDVWKTDLRGQRAASRLWSNVVVFNFGAPGFFDRYHSWTPEQQESFVSSGYIPKPFPSGT